MKLLEERIKKDGKVFPGDVLKIDSFLNHQIDTKLLNEMGKEFHRLFADTEPDKILTIEASGIGPATFTAKEFGYIPVIFAKKVNASNMAGEKYHCKEHSYTRNVEYDIQVAKEYLNEGEKILLIDDFLANGEAFHALIEICKQAKCEIVGCGSVVSKAYQPGEERIRKLVPHLEVLARVKSMNEADGTIEFCE